MYHLLKNKVYRCGRHLLRLLLGVAAGPVFGSQANSVWQVPSAESDQRSTFKSIVADRDRATNKTSDACCTVVHDHGLGNLHLESYGSRTPAIYIPCVFHTQQHAHGGGKRLLARERGCLVNPCHQRLPGPANCTSFAAFPVALIFGTISELLRQRPPLEILLLCAATSVLPRGTLVLPLLRHRTCLANAPSVPSPELPSY